MVSDVTLGTALNQQSGTAAASQTLASDFSQFLTLLTVQLQNQDPLSPMDSTEFTNQLVAFSGVEQQINANQKLDSLVSLMLGSSMSTSLSYVGKNIKYVSSEFNYDGSNPVEINYAHNGTPVESKIRIYSEDGELVYEQDASIDAGNQSFTWNGVDRFGHPVEPGTYEVKIDALDIDGGSVQATTVVGGLVRGVETQNGLIFLLVGERAVSLANVINVSDVASQQQRQVTLEDALQYVGKNVRYQASSVNFDGSNPASIDYQFSSAPNRAKIQVVNEDGEVVYEEDATRDTALNTFTWDGTTTDGATAPSGSYTIRINASNIQGNPVASTLSTTGHVRGAENQNGQIVLLIGTSQINLSAVLSVMETEKATTT